MPVELVPGSTYSAFYTPNSSASSTFSWSSAFTPTAGNCLLFIFSGGQEDSGLAAAPAGWQLVHAVNNVSSALSCLVLYKENCSASDTSITLETQDIASVSGIALVREYRNGKTSGIIDANGKAENETNVDLQTTTVSTGTTGTRSQAAGLGIAIAALDNGTNLLDNSTWSGSWTNVAYVNRSTSSGFRVAELALNTTAGQSASITVANDQGYGVILVLDEAVTQSGVAVRRFPRPILNF